MFMRLAALLFPCLMLAGLMGPARAQDKPLDRSVYILLDTSGSMSGTRIQTAYSAINILLDRLDAEGGYDVGFIRGTGDGIVVPLGPNNIANVRRAVNASGTGGGNPITSLQSFVGTVLPSISNRCHMLVIVTDGDDGSNPAPWAGVIRNQCSRVFIIGVDLSTEGVLRSAAAAGGGRFCNGLQPAAVRKCMIGVFRRFNFDDNKQACVDEAGIVGLNPAPTVQVLTRLSRYDTSDWSCMDFRPIDIRDQAWKAIFFKSGYDYRGSDFSKLDLSNFTIQGALAKSKFEAAKLTNVRLELDSSDRSVSLAGAQMGGAYIKGQGREAACVSGLNLSGTETDTKTGRSDQYSLNTIALCDPRVPDHFDSTKFAGVTLQRPRSQSSNLAFQGNPIEGLILDGGGYNAVSFSGGAGAVPPEVTGLKLNNITTGKLAFTGRKYRDADIRGTTVKDTLHIDSGQSDFAFRNMGVGKFLIDSADEITVAVAEINQVDIKRADTLKLTSVAVKISGMFDSLRQLSMEKLSSCVKCTIKSRGQLSFEETAFSEAALSGDFTITARQTRFVKSSWKAVPKPESAFDRVDISENRFENGGIGNSLGFPMSNLTAQGIQVCKECTILLPDGSDKLDFTGSTIESVISISAGSLRDLNLTRVKGAPLSGDTSVAAGAVRVAVADHTGGIALERLSLEGSNAHLSTLYGPIECLNCQMGGATVAAPYGKLTLERAQAYKATLRVGQDSNLVRSNFKASTWPDGINGARCESADFEAATIAGMTDVEAERCNFNGTRFDAGGLAGLKSVQSYGSIFAYARFNKIMIEKSTFDDGSFAFSQFKDSGMRESSFTALEFDAADLTGADISDTVFDSVRFNGPAGPAKLRYIHSGGADAVLGLKLINASLSGLDLTGLKLQGAELLGVTFANSNLERAHWTIMKMEDVSLSGANLRDARIEGDMRSVRFDGAKVDKLALSGTLVDGSFLNVVHDQYNGIFSLPVDMDGVDLRGLDLSKTIPSRTVPGTLRDLLLDGATVSCYWKTAIDASGADATEGSFTYKGMLLPDGTVLKDGDCSS